jgi:hypothetical protein
MENKSRFCDLSFSEYGSKAWANDLLRWFLREILYAETWKNHPEYKVILGKVIIEDLRSHGYFWQADRVINHLNRWKALQNLDLSVRVKIHTVDSCTAQESGDTLDHERERSPL